jgi:hypothetical protein
MKTIRLLQSLLIALGVFSGVVFAHGECPGTGVIDYSSMTCFFPDGSSPPMTIGVPSSGSSSGSSGSARPQPPKIINRYGAVAMNLNTGFFDSVYNESSRTTAEKSALSKCGSGCILISSYSNQCAAVGFGRAKNGKGGYRGIATNPDSKVAESKALASCNAKANNCQIILSECSKYN